MTGVRLRRPMIAAALFVAVFLYRFNGLGGALGGFDGDHFIYYLGAKAVAHGERPLRDFSDAGLQGAWPALTYELPALAQRLGGETLLPEAVFVVGALALAIAVLFVTAADLASTPAALIVAVLTMFSATKLYGYSKVLVFAVAVALFVTYVRRPSTGRTIGLGIWSAVAFLFRHDFLVYLAVSVMVLIVALGGSAWRETFKRFIIYAATVGLLLAAPIYSIQHYVGVGSYLESNRALVAQESNRTTNRSTPRWPAFDVPGAGLTTFFDRDANAIAFLYDLSVAIPVLALAALIGSPRASDLDPRQTRALIVSVAVLALVLDRFFLRNNFGARFGDLGAPIAVLAAWLPVRFRHARQPARVAVWTVTCLVLLMTTMSLSTTGSVVHELDTSGFSDSVQKIGRRVMAVSRQLAAVSPTAAPDEETTPNAAEYLRMCTAPSDRVLVIADAPEILAFAGRSFAGGQPTFRPGFYTLTADQQLTLDRLRHQTVPIVLTDRESTYLPNFAAQFPLIHAFVTERYEPVGELPALAGDPVRVLALKGRDAVARYRSTGLPCMAALPHVVK